MNVLRRPSARLLATEAPRAGLDAAALLATWPLLLTAKPGDGHPVLVLPGLLTGDPATALLRRVLRALGHQVHGWRLGTNRGPTSRVVASLRAQVDRLSEQSGQRVSLVGWSLGGVYAQELARATPGQVRSIITMGSPVLTRHGWARQASHLADLAGARPGVPGGLLRPWAEPGALRVPATSVYSQADGIAAWTSCRYPKRARRQNIEVRGSHLGLAHNPAVLWVLADRLAQADGAWSPFHSPLALRALFPHRR